MYPCASSVERATARDEREPGRSGAGEDLADGQIRLRHPGRRPPPGRPARRRRRDRPRPGRRARGRRAGGRRRSPGPGRRRARTAPPSPRWRRGRGRSGTSRPCRMSNGTSIRPRSSTPTGVTGASTPSAGSRTRTGGAGAAARRPPRRRAAAGPGCRTGAAATGGAAAGTGVRRRPPHARPARPRARGPPPRRRARRTALGPGAPGSCTARSAPSGRAQPGRRHRGDGQAGERAHQQPRRHAAVGGSPRRRTRRHAGRRAVQVGHGERDEAESCRCRACRSRARTSPCPPSGPRRPGRSPGRWCPPRRRPPRPSPPAPPAPSRWPLVRPWITGLPPASTSTAGAAAVCRTTSRACPAGTDDTSFDERGDLRVAARVEVRHQRDVAARGQVRVRREHRGAGAVGGVGGEERDLVRARRQVDGALAGARLEVVDRPLAVDVDVDGRVRDAVHDVDGARSPGRPPRAR